MKLTAPTQHQSSTPWTLLPPFLQVSNGFTGRPSDGLVHLDASHALTILYSLTNDGNLVQTAQADISQGGMLMLGLGFGTSQPAASHPYFVRLSKTGDRTQREATMSAMMALLSINAL